MKHIEDYLNELKEEKVSIMEVNIPYWRKQITNARNDFIKQYYKSIIDSLQKDLLELDNKITDVHNSILKMKAWDSMFENGFDPEVATYRANGLGVKVERAFDIEGEGLYYYDGDTEYYIKFRGE